MNNWEQCRNYGLIRIDSNNNVILYYNQYSYMFAGNPISIRLDEAYWQGSNLIVRGSDYYGNPRVYVMDGFNSYRQI